MPHHEYDANHFHTTLH